MTHVYAITYGHVTYYSGWSDEDIFEKAHEPSTIAGSLKRAIELVEKDAEATWRDGRYAGDFPGVAIEQTAPNSNRWHCRFASSAKNHFLVKDNKDLPWFMMIHQVEVQD